MSALDRLYAALDLPQAAAVERRVAKSLLAERGELSAADRRILETGLERLTWRATLRPSSAGLAPFEDETRGYREIVVMAAELRTDAKTDRLVEVIHRAIAHPLVLLAGDGEAARLSVGLKRNHEREAGRVVVERLTTGPDVTLADDADGVQAAFLASLDLAALPAHDLWSLHQGWGERAEAFAAGRITGTFRLADDAAQAAARREALDAWSRQAREIAALRKEAARETRLNRRIELSRNVASAEAGLTRAKTLLA